MQSAQHFYFSIATGDGPWYRYLIELLTISPIVLVLACTGLFTLPREHRACLFLLGFVVFSYALMCNVRYGMNLRYTTIWELPLAVFAAMQLLKLGAMLRPRGRVGGRRAGLCPVRLQPAPIPSLLRAPLHLRDSFLTACCARWTSSKTSKTHPGSSQSSVIRSDGP